MPSIKLPNLIIAGANRSGTTSLYTYLSKHKNVCVSTVKETNYFMPVFYNKNLLSIEKYASYFKHCNINSEYIMEASPRYFFGGEKIARAIYEQLGLVKVVFLLRDPVWRLFSYYRQRKASGELIRNMCFEEYVDRALIDFNNLRINNNNYKNINVYNVNVYIRGLAQGFYYDYLAQWYNIFGDSIKVFFFEDLKRDPYLFMNDVCNWLEIDSAIYNSGNFSVENKSISYKSYRLQSLAGAINDKFEGFFRKYRPLKSILREIYYFINELTNEKEGISTETFKKLDSVYEPYNKQLFDMLSYRGYSDLKERLWKNSDKGKWG